MTTKRFAYQNYPLVYKVTILGVDVTEYLDEIRNIEASLDYPNLLRFRLAEAEFTLKNDNKMFSPYQSNNFFVRNGGMITPPIKADGYRATVRLQAGYNVNGTDQVETIYEGQIINIVLDAKSTLVRIVCTDTSDQIREIAVTDFGLEKKMAVESVGSGLHGNYPFYSGLTPYSSESVESPPLMRRQYLNTEGPLNSINFIEEPNSGILTEGGRRSGNPIVQFKAPYRDRKISELIELLLTKYGITSTDISLPIATDDPYWQSLGRPYYELLFSNLSASSPGTWQWPGIMTDWVLQGSTHTIYLLISQTGSIIRSPLSNDPNNNTPQPNPRIIKWNLRDNTKSEVHEFNQSTKNEECWRLVADSTFNTFYILGCYPSYEGAPQGSEEGSGHNIRSGITRGSYSSSEVSTSDVQLGRNIHIHRLSNVQTSPTAIVYLTPEDASFRSGQLLPQLACYYHEGAEESDNFERRQGNLPDSRRSFHLTSGGVLYYAFANKTKFGVARANGQNSATEIISTRNDKSYNSSAFDFAIDEAASQVYFAYSHINTSTNSSRAKIVVGSL